MTTERLTQTQLEAIRKRAEAAIGRRSIKAVYPDKAFDVLAEDIPALLAEVERCREIERRLIEEVVSRTYVTYDKQLFEVVGKVSEILVGGDGE